MKCGPNVKQLIARKMSMDAIPKGGGFADGLRFLSSPEKIAAAARSAETWVLEAIRLVRSAADPNPWKSADDEAIAGELLKRVAEKRGR
jgi:hypothetical protein